MKVMEDGPGDVPAQPEPGRKIVKKKITVPPEYRGTESAIRWFARFELCSRCNEWDEDTMYSQVLPLLSGEALDLILDKDPEDIPDYDSVKDLLIQEFDNSELREQYVQDFKTLKLKEGEDYSAFMRSLKMLAKKAYPDFPEKPRNALVADRYREEMPEKVRAVLSLLSIETQDLDTLVTETRRLSKATDSKKSTCSVAAIASTKEAGATGGASNDTILAKLLEMESHFVDMKIAQSDIETRVNNLYSRPPPSARSRKPNNSDFGGICWNCGERGHLKRDCPAGMKMKYQASGKFFPNVICQKCKNPGHYSSQCRSGNA